LDDDEDEPKTAPTPEKELVKEVKSVGVDRSLLAVVGILERARGEESLIGWVRSGGLVPDLNDPNGWWINKKESEASAPAAPPTAKKPGRIKPKKAKKAELDAINLAFIFPPSSPSSSSAITTTTNPASSSTTTTPANPPLEVSSATAWYSSPPHVDFWIRQGVSVLSGMGVDLSHGVDLGFLDSMEKSATIKIELGAPFLGPPEEDVRMGEEGGATGDGLTTPAQKNGKISRRPPRKRKAAVKGLKLGGELGEGVGVGEREGEEGGYEDDEEMKVEKELMGDSSF